MSSVFLYIRRWGVFPGIFYAISQHWAEEWLPQGTQAITCVNCPQYPWHIITSIEGSELKRATLIDYLHGSLCNIS